MFIVNDERRLQAHTDWKPSIDFKHVLTQTLDDWRMLVHQNERLGGLS